MHAWSWLVTRQVEHALPEDLLTLYRDPYSQEVMQALTERQPALGSDQNCC